MKKLRQHQIEALNAIDNNIEGIINLPTGTGKTFIQANAILNHLTNDRVFVVLSPRILLTNQLYSEVKQVLTENNKDCQYLIVHSGQTNDKSDMLWIKDLPYREVKSTTSSVTIKEDYERAQRENVPLVIFGTYDSAERIVKSGIPIYMLFCDEAHYLVSEEFGWIKFEKNDNVRNFFHADRKYYFTATLKTTASDSGLGMNNEKDFGPIIYKKSPAEMIDAGEILRPRMHLVNVDVKEGDNEIDMDVNAILDAFREHRIYCKVAPKMLVVCKGSEHLDKIVKHPKLQDELESTPNLKIFDISSEHQPRINGSIVNRQTFLSELQSLTDQDPAIILHVKILTEGIDVPGITAVMPMNNLKQASFLQTLGRATRLHSNDRKRLYEQKLLSNELERFTKSFAFIIVPIFGAIGNDLKENFTEMIYAMRSYGFTPSEDVVIKQSRGKALPIPLEQLNELDTKEFMYKQGIYDILHDVEEKEKAEKLILEQHHLDTTIKNESLEETFLRIKNWF